jgi:SAM-dependent methyltransferase
VSEVDISVAADPLATACPFCTGLEFADFNGRPAARCVSCDSLERHRALAARFAAELADGDERRALEVGPASPLVFGGYLRSLGWQYTSIDQSRRGNPHDPRAIAFIDAEVDVRDLSTFADDTFGVIIAQHVLEEVDEFDQAVAELARVLGPAGVALLEIPFNPNLERTETHAPNHFGNVWRFGADLPERLRGSFARVDTVALAQGAYAGHISVCRHA